MFPKLLKILFFKSLLKVAFLAFVSYNKNLILYEEERKKN